MTLHVQDLSAEFYTPLRIDDRDSFADAWREAHYAAQAVVEVGKRWGDAREDDSHSALLFDPEDESWWSPAGEGFGPVRGRLDIGSGVVTVDRDEPTEGAWTDPSGRTPAELVAWVNATAERMIGRPPVRESVPAPDLPDHPLASGAAFAMEDTEALSDIDTIYAFTAHLLAGLIESQRETVSDGAHELVPRLWPHHFDLASLFVLARDEGGAMTKSIGVGVTPPDGIDASGYWYVSPWQRGAPPARNEAETLVPLDRGKWIHRDGLPMAVLPVVTIARLDDPETQSTQVVEFVAQAFNLCSEMMRRD